MYTLLNKIKSAKHLILAIILILPAFFLFFPKTFTTIDEHDYLYNAELLTSGGLKTDCSLNIPGQWQTNLGYCISKYNIGTSFFLVPSVLVNKDLAAITTLVVFIVGILIFYKIILHYSLDKRLIYLFAFFPPFIFFSRTILSEMYSMVMLLGMFYALLNINKSLIFKLLAGFFIGMALYIRYTNLIPVMIIGLYFLNLNYRKYGLKELIKKYWIVHIWSIITLFSILVFNNTYYGGYFRSGYYFSSEEGALLLVQIPAIFFKYFLLLNLFYPLALILMFKSKIRNIKLFVAVLLSMLFFYTILRNESFPGKLSDIILGLRFLIPVYPFLLLPYFERLDSLKKDKYYRIILYTSIAALFVANIAINYIHYKFILK